MNRLPSTHKWISLIAMGLLAVGVGCGEPMDGNNQQGDSDTASVHGQLEAEGEVEGKFATAYEVDGDGNTTLVSADDAEVASDGSFEVLIDLEVYSGGEVFVEVERRAQEQEEDAAQGSVLVEAHIQGDAQVDTAPINAETTFETHTFLKARSSGDWNDDCNTADHRSLISAEAAAEAKASADYRSEVEAMARATTSAMQASAKFLMEEQDKSRSQIEKSFEARSEARARLDAELLAAQTDSEAAAEAYLEAAVEARSDIEMDAKEQGREAQVFAESFMKASVELSSEVRHTAEAHVDSQRSFFVSAAAQAKLEALGVAESGRDNVASAASDLRSELRAAAQSGSEVGAQAWADFEAAIYAELNQEHAAILDEIDLESAMEAYASARADIDVQADAGVIAEGCVQAFVALWAEAKNELEGSLEGLFDSEAEAELLVALATHIELGSK